MNYLRVYYYCSSGKLHLFYAKFYQELVILSFKVFQNHFKFSFTGTMWLQNKDIRELLQMGILRLWKDIFQLNPTFKNWSILFGQNFPQ